jgi:putative GTP pyrophosphokinase
MASLKDIYDQCMPALERARDQLQTILVEVVAAIEDRTLVRAKVNCVRLKELSSIERKAATKGWQAEAALSACSDLIGGRVVCHNIEDVYRFAKLLKERLPSVSGEFEIQDYIENPNNSGYRALHVNFPLVIGGHTFVIDRVPCEVQIRSRLQDAWAELSHDDIYKQPELPDDLRARAEDLAEILAVADRIASNIRARITRERIPPEQRPNLRRVSLEGLTFLFNGTFGRSPPDYIIRAALNMSDELGINSLEGLPAILGREEFHKKVADAYKAIMPASIGAEDTFLAALYALARGEARAVSKTRRDARREWHEINQIARREMLARLPATIDELMEQLECPVSEPGIEGWAEALDATHACYVCSTTIVEPLVFADAALRHYGVADQDGTFHQRIETAIGRSSTETGGWGDGSLCAYHNERAAKED